MPQNCTILCPADDPRRVIELVREFIAGRGEVSITGKPTDWSSIAVKGSGATLELNRRVFRKRADEFSKMQLGMWMYFDAVETKHEAIKADVQRRVEEHLLAIGVVAEPEFVAEAGHYDCVFGLAAALGAIIWTGDGVVDAEGRLLLDGEGNSELPGPASE
jgi:hypothetical protein